MIFVDVYRADGSIRIVSSRRRLSYQDSMGFILTNNCYASRINDSIISAIIHFIQNWKLLSRFSQLILALFPLEFIKRNAVLARENNGCQLSIKVDPKIAIFSSDWILPRYEKGTELYEYFTHRIFELREH